MDSLPEGKAKEEWARANPDKLAREEYYAAFRAAKEELLSGKKPSTRPMAIILAGQSGAGKSKLRHKAIDELNEKGGGVIVDVDGMREFHPRYSSLAKADHETAATRVQPDASQMAHEIRAHATVEGYNLIIDGTLYNPTKAELLLKDLKQAGYEINVRALAVPKALSELGVATRLENALADPSGRTIPRIVEPYIQKETYDGLPVALDRIEKLGIADRVQVYERGSEKPIYDTRGHAAKKGSAASALTEARERPLSPEQQEFLANTWAVLLESAQKRNATQQTIDTYKSNMEAARQQVGATEQHFEMRETVTTYASIRTPHGTQPTRSHQHVFASAAQSPEPGLGS